MPNRRGEGAAGDVEGVCVHFHGQEDGEGDFQEVQGHDRHAGFFAEDAAGVAAAEIAAPVVTDVCAVEGFSDYVGEGDGTDKVSNDDDK